MSNKRAQWLVSSSAAMVEDPPVFFDNVFAAQKGKNPYQFVAGLAAGKRAKLSTEIIDLCTSPDVLGGHGPFSPIRRILLLLLLLLLFSIGTRVRPWTPLLLWRGRLRGGRLQCAAVEIAQKHASRQG